DSRVGLLAGLLALSAANLFVRAQMPRATTDEKPQTDRNVFCVCCHSTDLDDDDGDGIQTAQDREFNKKARQFRGFGGSLPRAAISDRDHLARHPSRFWHNQRVMSEPASAHAACAQFATTHWSVVLAAGHSSAPGATEALEKLCRAYWYSLYAYLRRSGRDTHDAQDRTQAFFARLIEKKDFALADTEKGKFRFYLLG